MVHENEKEDAARAVPETRRDQAECAAKTRTMNDTRNTTPVQEGIQADHEEAERATLTVDIAVVRIAGSTLQLLLVERKGRLEEGMYGLPGGEVRKGEEFDHAAERVMRETLHFQAPLEQTGYFNASPRRDPRRRSVSFPYLAFLRGASEVMGDESEALGFVWVPVADVDTKGLVLDHSRLAGAALHYLYLRLHCGAMSLQDAGEKKMLVLEQLDQALSVLIPAG
jgi:8-oxo-dGTP diphosphatase